MNKKKRSWIRWAVVDNEINEKPSVTDTRKKAKLNQWFGSEVKKVKVTEL